MILEENTNIPIQVYIKETCGIQYLKTIGVYNKGTGQAFFDWKELSSQVELPMSKSDHIELYMNGKRAYLTSWAEHIWTNSKKYVVLSEVHFVS